jgi:hypothetical protein
MRARFSLPVPSFPWSNGQDRGPSSRVCRFKSGRERQRGRSSVERAIALHAKDAGLTPAVSTIFELAVAQRPARVVRDDETAGSTPAGETSRFPCSSAVYRARGYDPRGRGFESLPGCQSWRRISEERVPACRAGVRGFKSRRRRQCLAALFLARRTDLFRRVAQQRESSRLLTGRLQVQLLPRRPTQMLG